MCKTHFIRATALALACSWSIAAFAQTGTRKQIDIPSGDLIAALRTLTEQSGAEFIYREDQLAGLRTNGARGALTAEQALSKLLQASGHEVRRDPSGVLMIVKKGANQGSRSGDNPAASSTSATAPGESKKTVLDLDTVTVTGSNIRGVPNLSVPIITIGREQIERSGRFTLADVIADLPQNFNSISDRQGTLYQSDENNYLTTGFGAGANLRGLGVDSTLVLLNGRRMARAGNDSFVDLTMIPLSAVDRVEVLTDGASALYGADAVGGVINIITRKDLHGAETRLRYGTVTDGGRYEQQATQMFGHSWDSGRAFFTYDAQRSTPLKAADRFTDINPMFSDAVLVPGADNRGMMLSVEQDLSERVSTHLEATHGKRLSKASYRSSFLGYSVARADSRNTAAGGGISIDLDRDWQLRIDGSGDRNVLDLTMWIGPTLDTLQHNYDNILTARIKALDVVADGPLMQVGGGQVRFAAGAGGRWEDLRRVYHNSDGSADDFLTRRRVSAGFAELTVPLFGAANRRPGLERLELSLAARGERYSDFGSSINPKLGVAWAPLESLNLRGSIGTSFKAPTLSQTAHGLRTFTYYDYFVDESGSTNVMILLGSTAKLRPEKSRNWSVGFDYRPTGLSGLNLSVTYFNVNYRDRIGSPFPSGYSQDYVILDPTYQFLVARSPAAADVAAYLDEASFSGCYDMANFAECDARDAIPDVKYIVDTRTRNLAKVRQAGVDFLASYEWESAAGRWNLETSGMKMLRSTKQFAPGGEPLVQLNEVGYPVDLRFRSSLNFARKNWSATVAARYTDSYKDSYYRYVGDFPRKPGVASSTTIDLSVQTDIARYLGWQWLREMELKLAATNVFDRKPPYVATYYGLNYDVANADPVGRFVSAQLRAAW
ncbi:MAG: TonB-dependent receptor [Rhodanobacter sp.]